MTKVVTAGASALLVWVGIAPAQAAAPKNRRRRSSTGAAFAALGAGLLLLATGGCSTLSLGYGQGANLAYWWLDRYVDFNEEQKPRVRAALQDWMTWHRGQPLADDIALLELAAREVRADTTPAQLCTWWDKVELRRNAYLTQLLPAASDIAATLEPRQLRAIEARQISKDADWRDDHLQPKPADRLDGEVKRVRERAELLYGKLDAGQRRFIVERLQGRTPWDAVRWHEHMLREQAALLQALRAVAAAPPGSAAATEARKQLADALLRPDAQVEAATRTWREQLLVYQCSVGAELHNRTTAQQRETAARNLLGWAQDLRGHVLPAAALHAASGSPG